VVRLGRFAAALSVAILAPGLRGEAVRAQSLQHLTVQTFALSADTAAPRVDVPFALIVTLRVRERVARIDNLELPLLAELELLGDERRLQSDSHGTVYRETIAVVAHHGGTLDIGSALLQAIDARDKRAKQYATNRLRLVVTGAPANAGASGDVAGDVLWTALRVFLWFFGVACAVAVAVLLFRRRREPPVAATIEPPAEPEPPVRLRSERDELLDALSVLRAEPTRASAIAVRALVWRMLGADEGATLADVLQRTTAAPAATHQALRALERAAFTYDGDVPAAVADARAALERCVNLSGNLT
jgi:hypothetical protein